MITRRDNLLIRPWQQKKFENHRKKVESALPAIDNSRPPDRVHVSVKWKKHQKETERVRNIERDNLLLLQKLNHIMKTSRVDNWLSPQPSFLNRLGIYSGPIYESKPATPEIMRDYEKIRSRREKCPACTPQKTADIKFPEERVPWEPMKKPTGHSFRSKSVPPKKSQPLPTIKQKSQPASANAKLPTQKEDNQQIKTVSKPTENLPKTKKCEQLHIGEPRDLTKTKNELFYEEEPHKIVLNRGCLKLSVNFPPDTVVKFHTGNVKKCVMRGLCHCKNSPVANVY